MPTYRADNEKISGSLVIPSPANVSQDAEKRMPDGTLDRLRDGDGWFWDLDITVSQVADPKDPKGLSWLLKIKPMTNMTASDLLDQGVLDSQHDERLLALIADRVIPMQMKPSIFHASDEAAIRSLIRDLLPRLKNQFLEYKLVTIKRTLVHRWVDESRIFE